MQIRYIKAVPSSSLLFPSLTEHIQVVFSVSLAPDGDRAGRSCVIEKYGLGIPIHRRFN